jgi:hypothetical protein
MNKQEYERAWNASLENLSIRYPGLKKFVISGKLNAPGMDFDEWYEREVVNPPEGWDYHRDT